MQDSLLSKVMRQKYFRNGDMFSGKPKQGDSFVWKSIRGVLEMFCSGTILIDGRWFWEHFSSGDYTVNQAMILHFVGRWPKSLVLVKHLD